jgi:hypothetical protein
MYCSIILTLLLQYLADIEDLAYYVKVHIGYPQ